MHWCSAVCMLVLVLVLVRPPRFGFCAWLTTCVLKTMALVSVRSILPYPPAALRCWLFASCEGRRGACAIGVLVCVWVRTWVYARAG